MTARIAMLFACQDTVRVGGGITVHQRPVKYMKTKVQELQKSKTSSLEPLQLYSSTVILSPSATLFHAPLVCTHLLFSIVERSNQLFHRILLVPAVDLGAPHPDQVVPPLLVAPVVLFSA